MVKVELFDNLDAVESDAAGALDRGAQPCLYHRLSWFRLLEQHCPPAGKLKVARAQDGERRAWLFLANGGHDAQAYAAWYSLRVGLIGDAGLAPDLARALGRTGLARLNLAPVEDAASLAGGLAEGGWLASVAPATGNWIAHTQGLSFEQYWASRPGRLRNTAQRKAKAAGLEIAIHDRFDAQAWTAYEDVYRASWKPEEGSFPFLRALAQQEGAAGTLRLGIARKDGRAVAAQLWTVEGGEATIHKLAYAEDAKPLSPGTVLGMAMFRRAIDQDRVAVIDYGTGDDAYKRDWMDERRQLWRLTAFNRRRLRGLAGAARAQASKLVARVTSR
jgi:CelD/BcsL family acetyltransferase involved in cellulose biosynthesis